MYMPDQMLRNLAPREMTAAEQREADEQRGQIAAAVARWGHRVAVRARAIALPAARAGTSARPFERLPRHGMDAREHGSTPGEASQAANRYLTEVLHTAPR
jgi:hypothetical protein